MDEPMWEYWRDKKGVLEAIEEQYPEVLRDNQQIASIVGDIRNMLDLLDFKMEKIDGKYKDEPR